MVTVMMVMVVMNLLAIIVCKHAEQLHRMVTGAFVDLETSECRQIDQQQQSYRDIACKLFHFFELFYFEDERHTGVYGGNLSIAEEVVCSLKLSHSLLPRGKRLAL